MGKSISVYTSDKFLFQKILLDAPNGVTVLPYESDLHADIYLWDIDSGKEPIPTAVTMSRRGGAADISLPFAIGTVKSLIDKDGNHTPQLSLSEKERCVYLRGERIRLTEVEFSLLNAIISRGDGYAAREELLSEVWDGKADNGVINVYIHYLREKLEKHGEKIILSSRKQGYRIDGKFLGGGSVCSE